MKQLRFCLLSIVLLQFSAVAPVFAKDRGIEL